MSSRRPLPRRGDLLLVGAEHDGYMTSFDPVPGIVLECPEDDSGVYTVHAGGRVRFVHSRWLFYMHPNEAKHFAL